MSRLVGDPIRFYVEEDECFHYFINGQEVLIISFETRYLQINCFGLWRPQEEIVSIQHSYEIFERTVHVKTTHEMMNYNKKHSYEIDN